MTKGLTRVGVVRAAGVVQPDGAVAVTIGGATMSVLTVVFGLGSTVLGEYLMKWTPLTLGGGCGLECPPPTPLHHSSVWSAQWCLCHIQAA